MSAKPIQSKRVSGRLGGSVPFTTLTRQVTLEQPTHHDDDIYTPALEPFDKTWMVGKAVCLVGVGVSGFDKPEHQMSLWHSAADDAEKKRLENALDDLKQRFGDKIIRRGSELLDEDL